MITTHMISVFCTNPSRMCGYVHVNSVLGKDILLTALVNGDDINSCCYQVSSLVWPSSC